MTQILEQEEEEAQQYREPSEFRMYALDPAGFKVNWQISASTSSEQLNNLIQRQQQLSNWLRLHDYTPDDFGVSARATGGRPQATTQPTKSASGAEWIMEPDGSRSCSLHGPGKWVPPGTSKKTGKPYNGFWACQTQDCKPREIEP